MMIYIRISLNVKRLLTERNKSHDGKKKEEEITIARHLLHPVSAILLHANEFFPPTGSKKKKMNSPRMLLHLGTEENRS